jgi:medium-chain acyl-[acyl-carrier-protein] hydrolase
MTDVADWFGGIRVGGDRRIKLFCFPYAGGSSSLYKDWKNSLPVSVQVVPVELPGRGTRLNEPRLTSMKVLIQALAPAVGAVADTPFALFGHSLGAVIAFELARSVRREYGRKPEILFVSGRRGPQIPDSEPPSYNLPDDEFIRELRRIGGTPEEVLEHAEMMELMIPLLRSDFQLIQTYQYTADEPFDCPMVAYDGLDDDEETSGRLAAGRDQTTSRFALHMLPGGHCSTEVTNSTAGDARSRVADIGRRAWAAKVRETIPKY